MKRLLLTKESPIAHATLDFPLDIKSAGDETGVFEGYASINSNVDSYGERVMPGAFADSLAKHKREGTMPLMLWQHSSWDPIGVWTDLSEDGKGLYGKGELLTELQRGKEAHILLKRKAIRGLSIGYREIEVEEAKNGQPRLLKKVDLLEVSLVTFPANPKARVESVKSGEISAKWLEFGRLVRDGEPPAAKDFEDLLREAGIPKSMAMQIAAVGYVKAVRSESDREANHPDLSPLLQGMKDLQAALTRK